MLKENNIHFFLTLSPIFGPTQEEEVINRIKSSLDDPLGYENAGFALLDMCAERRGNLFGDEVYRITKAKDATSTYPLNHKFSRNDVITLTLQNGVGDFFDISALPISDSAVLVEARVLNSGPYYVDVVVQSGSYEAAFGPASNIAGPSDRKDSRIRLRVDRFFSDVPYSRMVSALSQLSAIPENTSQQSKTNVDRKSNNDQISVDDLLRHTILFTHGYSEPYSLYYEDEDICDLQQIVSEIYVGSIPIW